MAKQRRSFGYIRRLPNKSKRYQASYTGPDGVRNHTAPSTFQTALDAEAWLAAERRLIERGDWTPPTERRIRLDAGDAKVFRNYAAAWLADRSLKPTTRQHYSSLLERQINPTFGDLPLEAISPVAVRAWHANLGGKTPTLRSHAYGLLRTILGTAVEDREIVVNPCHIRGAGTSKRVKKVKPASLGELETIASSMPQKYQLMVLLASWCALRFGELVELRRKDIDLKNGIIHVRRGATRAYGGVVIGTPKSDAGTRDVAIPPHLVPLVKSHLSDNVAGGREGLLFPAADGVSTLAPSTLYRVFYKAREAAGRPDLRFHDLRHTGAVLAAQTGATLAELMGRLGHSTPGAAMRYQHAAKDRDVEIARLLSAMVEV
ncbi:MAG: tyrosine-type recombinase/integrase [Aeromicrobium sp.]